MFLEFLEFLEFLNGGISAMGGGWIVRTNAGTYLRSSIGDEVGKRSAPQP